MTKTMTETEFAVASNEYAGLCLACGAISYGGIEPKTKSGFCDECGARQVMSLENALETGHIDVVPETAAPTTPQGAKEVFLANQGFVFYSGKNIL